MSHDRESVGPGGGRFHAVQPLRDLESNWAVDLSKNLEEYLLKICSGEIIGEDSGPFSINFAEAALLLQGSIQVYSRKVEYLYSLVLHALELISQDRQNVGPESAPTQEKENSSQTVHDEENDNFWDLDNIPVDENNSLDILNEREDKLDHFVKPPANLVVLEGDCLDSIGDGGELETYLLSTSNLYCDFIILEPCDSATVDDYIKDYKFGRNRNGSCRGASLSKSQKILTSPGNQSGRDERRQSTGKNKDVNLARSPQIDKCDLNDSSFRHDPFASGGNLQDFGMCDGHTETGEFDASDDDHDPWKPLNPHEPGNMKVKSFKKAIAFQREMIKLSKCQLHMQFPLAKLHGTISPEFSKAWEAQLQASERQEEPQFPPYEKLRQALVDGFREKIDLFYDQKDDNDEGGLNFDLPVEMPEKEFDYDDVPMKAEKHDDDPFHFNEDACGQEDPCSQESLEDLCRSHLDALLATIAETEKQTEIAARVSTWKQRIEHNLEEQELLPQFDIHEYGERVLDKLSSKSGGNSLSFADCVYGLEKHDVARTFSSLLQLVTSKDFPSVVGYNKLIHIIKFKVRDLKGVSVKYSKHFQVNNRNVDLEKNGGAKSSVCYTATNPFHVHLLNHQVVLRSSKKRLKSPAKKGYVKDDQNRKSGKENNPTRASLSPSQAKSNLALKKSGKLSGGNIRLTPEAKRRRSCRIMKPIDLIC